MPALQHEGRPLRREAPDHDAPLPRVPAQAVHLGQDEKADARLEARLPRLGHRDLPSSYRAQGDFERVAPSRPRDHAEDYLAPSAPHPLSVRDRGRPVRRASRRMIDGMLIYRR